MDTKVTETNNEEISQDDKDFEDLVRKTLELPPITGDMVKDYVGLINKEMAATAAVWKEFHDVPNVEKNPLITNHMTMMCNMYEQLLKVADTFNDPKKLEEVLKQAEENNAEEG